MDASAVVADMAPPGGRTVHVMESPVNRAPTAPLVIPALNEVSSEVRKPSGEKMFFVLLLTPNGTVMAEPEVLLTLKKAIFSPSGSGKTHSAAIVRIEGSSLSLLSVGDEQPGSAESIKPSLSLSMPSEQAGMGVAVEVGLGVAVAVWGGV